MANKKKADVVGMFANLAAQEEEPVSTTRVKKGNQKKKKVLSGKRSNPNFVQVGAYIPKKLHKRVKRELVDYEGDFSDLVSELLEEWLNQLSD